MADTERLINKAQGDSIISAIQGITARLQEMYTVDDAMSSSSENPVQNKVITAALDNKVDKVEGKGLSTNDYTNEDKASVANSAEQLESTQTVSGNPITLTDAAPINAESLVVELEPKQDLHGQSAPYVGGAGKQKLPLKVEWIKAANTYGTWSGNVYTINGGTVTILTDNYGNVVGIENSGTFSATSEFYLSDSIYLPDGAYILNGVNAQSTQFVYQLAVAPYSGGAAYYDRGVGVDMTLDGSVRYKAWYRIDSGASTYTVYPMIRLSTETDPTFAPWSNICPITGYTECSVDDVGKNRVEEAISDTSIDVDGAIVSDSRYDMCIAKVKQGVQYVVTTNDGGLVAGFFTEKPTSGSVSYNTSRVDTASITFTAPIDGYIAFRTYADYATPQCEEGSTATPYEPYHSSNATIQFGQTVYGGRSNFTEGGTDDEWENVDLGSLTWTKDGNDFLSSELSVLMRRPSSVSEAANMLCECFDVEAQSNFETKNGSIAYFYTNSSESVSKVVVYLTDTSLQDFMTIVNGQKIVYEKATPTTISTPPTDLKLLKGTNNINTNGTTINLGYQPDNVVGELKGEIEKITVMPYLRILDNDIDTEVKNYRLYYRLISSSYTLVNLAEMLQHRFLFVEIIQNPSGTANHTLLHSALIDSRTIDGFEYQMKAGTGDTVIIESNIAENKFDLSVRYTGTHTSGDPTDYYVTIRMVD